MRCDRSHRFDLWFRKIPWRRQWPPTSGFLPGKSLWTEEPGGLQSMGLQRHNLVIKQWQQCTYTHWYAHTNIHIYTYIYIYGLPLWLSWWRIHLQWGRPGFNSWLGKSPWRRERPPTAVFWPGEVHGLYSQWGCKESDKTEWLSHHICICIAESLCCTIETNTTL